MYNCTGCPRLRLPDAQRLLVPTSHHEVPPLLDSWTKDKRVLISDTLEVFHLRCLLRGPAFHVYWNIPMWLVSNVRAAFGILLTPTPAGMFGMHAILCHLVFIHPIVLLMLLAMRINQPFTPHFAPLFVPRMIPQMLGCLFRMDMICGVYREGLQSVVKPWEWIVMSI